MEIKLFAMKNLPDGSSTICEPNEVASFYDVIVQDAQGEIVEEKEDMVNYADAEAALDEMVLKYPDAGVSFSWE